MTKIGHTKITKPTRRPYLAGVVVLGSAVAGLLMACSDDGSDVLTRRSGGANAAANGGTNAGPSSSTTTPGYDGSDGGGTGTGPGTGGPGTVTLPDGGTATVGSSSGHTLFKALEPALVSACGGPGGACHVTGSYQNSQTPVWLGSPDDYASIVKYPGIVVSDPYSSKLIVKGPHEGPAFTGPNKALGDSVLAWLTQEALAIKQATLPSTDPFAVAAGPVSVDISKASTGIDGAKVTFTAAVSGTIVTLTNLSVVAPAATGVHIAHPIFVVVSAGKPDSPDPVDSLSNLDQIGAAGATTPLGTGTLVLENFVAGAQLKIEFTKLEKGTVADAGATGGCKSVATFTANAVPAIQNNQCLNCHGAAGGSGYGSLDLSQVGKDDTLACAQALNKVTRGNAAQSDIILAPTGGVAAHPFKNADANYKTMMTTWINNE